MPTLTRQRCQNYLTNFKSAMMKMLQQVIMNIGEWFQWENKGDMERFSEPEMENRNYTI